MCPLCNKKAEGLCQRCIKRWVFDEDRGFYHLKKRARVKHKGQMELTRTCRRILPGLDVLQEVAFPELASDKGVLLRYDIFIPELKLLIEYRGCTKFVKFVHRTRARWNRTRFHSTLKKTYAEESGLILVNFTHRDKVGNDDMVLKRIHRYV